MDRKRENRRFAFLKKIDALERKHYVLLSKEGQPIATVHLCNDHCTPEPKHFDSDAQMTIVTTATRTEDGLPVVMSPECWTPHSKRKTTHTYSLSFLVNSRLSETPIAPPFDKRVWGRLSPWKPGSARRLPHLMLKWKLKNVRETNWTVVWKEWCDTWKRMEMLLSQNPKIYVCRLAKCSL